MTTTSVYAEIFKTAPQEDGSLLVHGKATGSDLDLDQQQCDPTWLKKAMPEWFKIGNVRESHDAKRAVGKATEYEATEGGDHMITAKVIDPLAKAKVEAGILTGFSIGIKSPRIMKSATVKNGIITDGQIIEVSLVDRPALPTATLTICKSAEEGWTGSPEDYDADRNLVHVEELTIQNEEAAKASKGEDKKPAKDKDDDLDDEDEKDAEGKKDPKKVKDKDKEKSASPSPLDMPGAIKSEMTILLDGKPMSEIAQEQINKAIAGLSDVLQKKRPAEGGDAEKATDIDKLSDPAPGQKCADCGEDGHLACKSVEMDEVEEFDIESTKALVESILKSEGHDEGPDIAGAEQAIKQIAALIQSEAKAMADMPAQDCDIHLLMSAVDALRIFANRERMEQGNPQMALSAEPEKTKGSKYSAEQMESMLKSGKAMANPKGDPSYPIADEEDLKNAIRAVGRGSGDHGKIKSHIIKRAKALGKADLLPDDWTSKTTEADSTEPSSTEKTVEPDIADLDISKALTGAIEDDESDLNKALTSRIEGSIEKALGDFTAKAEELVTQAFDEIRGRLETVEKMAAPGGPALRRTEQEVKTSRKQDLLGLAEIEERKAATPGLDTVLRLGYQEKAARLRADANSL